MKISALRVLVEGTAITGKMAQLSSATAALRSVLYGSGVVTSSRSDTSLPISVSALTLAFTEITRTHKALKVGNITVPEVAVALAEYQQLLREFKSNLPRFQGWLLAQRARLATRGAHSTAVESWVKANRQTRKSASLGRTKP